ncbi:hypothetical protein Q8A67_008835 [Cirrhinus molitorella]|uniref:C1q domain-containing protein n=1 Tax=Cirrhinus molitorella TaxID=172907 RepID=A0AA88PZ48_9TELE|nr:hypothetical protein Q8A67_008835 [Cirrhinus molitorella]
MLILITILMLNVWAIPADDLFPSNINILEELGKIKIIETRMQSMEEEMERLRTENTALTTKLKTFEEKTEVSERVKVAFSASLSTLKDGFQFIGPYTQTTTLVYKNAITNIGNAYNNNSGIFTAPVKGVYFFNFVVFNPHDISTGVKLLKNGNVVVTATDNPPKQDTEDTTFNSVSLILEQGDHIYLQLMENCRVYTDKGRRNTFSGHLLFTM